MNCRFHPVLVTYCYCLSVLARTFACVPARQLCLFVKVSM